ncbi:hypothetical protein F5Y08DRAFT_336912 [Xylaria arbuscula]|nr:hypothetical protein F5Y08DRAFT_336912 [Xylaria arbuscula]
MLKSNSSLLILSIPEDVLYCHHHITTTDSQALASTSSAAICLFSVSHYSICTTLPSAATGMPTPATPATPAKAVVTPSKGFHQGKRKRDSVNTGSRTKSQISINPPSTPVRPPQWSPPKKRAKVSQEVVMKNEIITDVARKLDNVKNTDKNVVKEPSVSVQNMQASVTVKQYILTEKEKIKLKALLEKAGELQGYVNQLQDAVTIAMCQLRDLKNNVIAALESTDGL